MKFKGQPVEMDNRSQHSLKDLPSESGVNNGTLTDETSANLLYNTVIPSFGAIIILSNLAVVVSSWLIWKRGKETKTSYLFLGNIAFANILAGIGVVFGQLFPEDQRNQQICEGQIGLIVSSILISVNLSGLIGLDRLLYVLYGIHYKRWVHPVKLLVLVGIEWIFCLLIGYIPLMGWSGDTKDGEICWFVTTAPQKLIFITVIIAAVPPLFIAILYSIILPNQALKNLTLKTHKTTQLHDTGQHPKSFLAKIFKKKFSTSVSTSKRWKSIKLVFFTTGGFIFTWFPYMIVSLYYVSVCDDNVSKKCKSLSLILASPLTMLGFANTLLNPIVYAWWHKGFNSYIKRRISTFRFTQPRGAVINGSSNATMTTMLESSNGEIRSI